MSASSGNYLLPKSERVEMPSYYETEIGNYLRPETRRALQDYTGLSAQELESHLLQIREKAWRASPYPCIGMWSFLRPGLPRHPKFGIITEIAKWTTPESYLICDVGTGLGQELRALTIAGVSSRSLRAIDVIGDLWDIGFELFRDKERMDGAIFNIGNVLAPEESPFTDWKGTMDVVLAGNLLHCFDWEGQILALNNLTTLVKHSKGAMVVGWQLGGVGEHVKSKTSGKERFSNSEETFMKMLRQIDEDLETEWQTELKTVNLPKEFLKRQSSWLPRSTSILSFSLTRK